ncbi:MAG: hypothetical protein ABSE56_19965, partial [Bryobacteraceae bacterium]
LPHWVPEDSIVFVTWRLAGTLPQVPAEVFRRDPHPGRFFLVQDRRLDSTPQGPRWLQDPRIARVVAEALAYGERVRRAYDLFAWVILPNHVHLEYTGGKTADATRGRAALRQNVGTQEAVRFGDGPGCPRLPMAPAIAASRRAGAGARRAV